MVDTIRTKNILLTTMFQDGQAPSSITPQDMRDFIISIPMLSLEIITVTGNTILTPDNGTVLVDASAASLTITLPSAIDFPNKVYNIKKIDSSAGKTVTIDGAASQTIDGQLTQIISTQWTSVTIQSNGANWFIL